MQFTGEQRLIQLCIRMHTGEEKHKKKQKGWNVFVCCTLDVLQSRSGSCPTCHTSAVG